MDDERLRYIWIHWQTNTQVKTLVVVSSIFFDRRERNLLSSISTGTRYSTAYTCPEINVLREQQTTDTTEKLRKNRVLAKVLIRTATFHIPRTKQILQGFLQLTNYLQQFLSHSLCTFSYL